ncbi:MAG TPA: FAD-binding protein [Dehalococcoidia bacterium]|jgi:hypothetical protein
MTMESLGGDMPAGRPVAISSGSRTHVFAIAKGGPMNHWISTDGGPWSGPSPLPGGNLATSFPCAIALPDGSVHVFAIGTGGLFNGGPLAWWSSVDGTTWPHVQLDQSHAIAGNGNGLAAASLDRTKIDVFAITTAGIIQYSLTQGQASANSAPLPGSTNLQPCVLAAVSSEPGKLDVFAVDPSAGTPLHWHFDGAWIGPTPLPGPPLHINKNNGFAAAAPALGRVELFAITGDNRMTNWSLNGVPVLASQLPSGSWSLPDGVPAVVAEGGKLDVFAIGPGDVLRGGSLVRWRFDGGWSEPVAYEAGLAAGGVGAAHGASGLEAFAFQWGTSNSLQHWPAGIGISPHKPWENWAGNRRTDPIEGHCYPTCLEELVAIVKTATQQNKRARAVGSSWSFSDIAVTPGYVVETSKLNKHITTVLSKALLAPSDTVPTPNHLVHVEAGIQLEKLMDDLDNSHRAPFTMGGAAGQTLAGVISTSVHGSHFKLGPFPDFVRAIHLVGPDGKQYWIEPKDKPITDPDHTTKLQEALGPEVTIKHDNDWFDTALVTVGSLGIVYAVVLEVTDEYKLHETRTEIPWSGLKPKLSDATVFADADGVQVAIDPGSMGSSDPLCFLSKRVSVPFTTASTALGTSFDPLAAFCEGDLILESLFEVAKAIDKERAVIEALLVALPAVPAVVALTALFPPALLALAAASTAAAATPILYPLLKAAGPGAIGDVLGVALDKQPQLVGGLASFLTKQAQGATPAGGVVDIAHNVMARRNKGECAARGLALEIAFDADGSQHIDFIDAALALLKDEAAMGHMLGGWFSIRFVGRSRAILSPQQSTMTCMVEVVGLRTLSSTKLLLNRLEALGRDFGGIQHWGMFDDLRATDVATAYPRLNTWRKIRYELTNGGTVNTFDNDFTTRCGLSEAPLVEWYSAKASEHAVYHDNPNCTEGNNIEPRYRRKGTNGRPKCEHCRRLDA